MFEIKIKTDFAAAHQLRGYPGNCERLHGHNYHVEVICQCEELDKLGMGIDFNILKGHIKSVVNELDHYNLNEKPYFIEINPSAENIAKWFYGEISRKVNDDRIKLVRIDIWETDFCCASYFETAQPSYSSLQSDEESDMLKR